MSTTTTPHTSPLPPRGDLRRRVLAGEPAIGVFANLGSLASTEIMARAGYDWILVDLEHGMGTQADLLAQLLAVQSTHTTALVRVASSERLRIGRALDFGADGLMIPRLETPAEVVETLSWMHYPPVGTRGVALPSRGGGFGAVAHGDVAGAVNPQILGVFQVESPAAVAASMDLAALDGVDVLFVGPADLSHAMGIPGRFDEPEFGAALETVIAACRKHGKAAGILVKDGAAAAPYAARGFTFIGVGSDVSFVSAGAKAQLAAAKASLVSAA